MKEFSTKLFTTIFSCPNCGGEIILGNNLVECKDCRIKYPINKHGQIDFRLKQSLTKSIELEVGGQSKLEKLVVFGKQKMNPKPAVKFNFSIPPYHMTPELLSYFPRANGPDSLMLDLGCGDGIHKQISEEAGFAWLGLDYESKEASLLGDGHSLPFKDNVFEFVLSVAVLEHIALPILFMREIYRVLKSEGVLIGTVSFMEPFHSNSYYHHSYLGVANSLYQGGFSIDEISASPNWVGIKPLSQKHLFPALPKQIVSLLMFPLQILHRLWWKIGYLLTKHYKFSEEYRLKQAGGAYAFVAHRQSD